MTESKSTRDYIRNWGRTAARSRHVKTFEYVETGLNIGKVRVQWSDNRNDFVWLSSMNFDTQTWHNTFESEAESVRWVHSRYYSVMKSSTFGRWLQIMCKRHQITQAGLAERLHVTRQTVHNWVKDKRQCHDLTVYHQIVAMFAELEQMSQKDMMGHMSLLFKPR